MKQLFGQPWAFLRQPFSSIWHAWLCTRLRTGRCQAFPGAGGRTGPVPICPEFPDRPRKWWACSSLAPSNWVLCECQNLGRHGEFLWARAVSRTSSPSSSRTFKKIKHPHFLESEKFDRKVASLFNFVLKSINDAIVNSQAIIMTIILLIIMT